MADLASWLTTNLASHRPSVSSAIPSTAQTGFVNSGQLFPWVGSMIGGELGQSLGSLVPIWGSLLGIPLTKTFQMGRSGSKSQKYFDLGGLASKSIQLGYGGNVGQNRQLASVLAPMRNQQILNLGQAASQAMGKIAQSLNIPISPEALSKYAPMIGSILQTASAFVPSLQTYVAAVAPGIVLDYSPLIDTAYRLSNGNPTPQLVEKLVTDFHKTYDAGGFSQVPAQLAVDAVNVTSAKMGNRFSIGSAANVAKAADAFVKNGLGNFGNSLNVVLGMGLDTVARDPKAAVQYANQVGQIARSNGVSGDMLEQVAAVAQKQGAPVHHAILSAALSGRVAQETGGIEGSDQLQGAASDAIVRTATDSPALRALSSAYETGGDVWRTQIDQARKSSRPDAIWQLAQRASQIPQFSRDAVNADTQRFTAGLSPDQLQASTYGDLMSMAHQSGSPDLARLLKNPTELAKRMETMNWQGVSPEARHALSLNSPTHGRLAGTAIAVAPKFNKVKPYAG